jgi:hypothetical protein
MVTTISQLDGLRSVAFEAHDRHDWIPSVCVPSVSQMSRLTSLSLTGVHFDDAPEQQQLPSSLQAFSLHFCFDEEDVDLPVKVNLGHLTSLTRLEIWSEVHSESVLPPKLKWFETRISDTLHVLGPMMQLPSLQSLHVGLFEDRVQAFSGLTKMTWLTDLELNYMSQSHASTAAIWGKLPGLSTLHLDSFELSATDDGAANVQTPRPAYAFLHLSEVRGLRKLVWRGYGGGEHGSNVCALLCEVVAGLRGLQHLEIERVRMGVNALQLRQLTQLTCLMLENCEVPDIVASAVGISLRQLVHLNLEHNEGIADGCMPSLALLVGLTDLQLCGTKVTEVGLMQCTSLRRLKRLSAPREVDTAALVKAIPGLNTSLFPLRRQ